MIKLNEIKVEHEEIWTAAGNLIKERLSNHNFLDSPKDLDDFISRYLEIENGQNYMRLFEQLQEDKVIDFIKEQISIKEETVDVEKFKKIIEN